MREQVGRYIIKGQLGKGAMGVVYLAEDPLLNRQAAIKTVDLSVDDPAEREFLRGRLLRDARAAAGLTHPNIVSVYDVVEEGDAAYLVLEFIPGDTLAARLTANAIPDLAFTIHVLSGMAAALDYTHARGVIHRDIKPANVMIDPFGTPKIMDFGIARIADSRTNTPTGMVMGTIDYMSPEQIKGEPIDGRSDQFALAALAVRMLTGQTLYGQHSLPTLAYKIVHEPPPQLRARNAALPAAADAVLVRALAKTPQERYATCTQFVQDLSSALALTVAEPPTRVPAVAAPLPQPVYQPSAPLPVYQPPAQAARPQPAVKKISAAAFGALLALLAVGGILAVWRPWAPAKPAIQVASVVSPQPSPAANTAPEPAAVTPAKRKDGAPKSDPPKKETAPSTPPVAVEADFTPPPDTQAVEEEEKPPSDAPRPAQDAYDLARKLAQNHRFPEAIDAYNKALSIRTKWPLARFYRGRAYQQINNCPAAIEDFNTMLRARDKYAPGYTYRGLCEIHEKDEDAAFADLDKAISLNPKLPMAFFGRGVIYNHRGGYNKALADLNAAIAMMPDYPNAYQARAVARRKLGDRSGASADDAKAQELINAGRSQGRPN